MSLVLKFHTFRHAVFMFKLMIQKNLNELFHGEIAISITAFMPVLPENDEAR
ncbi:hypothetical protein P262_p1013 (plasmid) [Cronobacter malonaticus]|uniref:Uncharacterized protein n=1 Tax=Cronobacter malonaticus TaxID=413503 RepID=V5U4P5_9ENTR|nr:hypothetical protein P262_p1013 [Cronobacter malonaticus]